VTTARRALLVVCMLGGCKAGPHAQGPDAGTQAPDAGPEVHAASAPHPDASPPPDDTILPETGDELRARAGHLLEAIAQDDATLAGDILFPRNGWLASRDAPDPGKDWDSRLATPFRRAVHALSRRHRDLSHAQVVSIELGGAITQTTPRRRGWKKALWTVSGSRLTFLAEGHTRVVSIREMVAWRGAWYVTRL
jgi:hypothetical protein